MQSLRNLNLGQMLDGDRKEQEYTYDHSDCFLNESVNDSSIQPISDFLCHFNETCGRHSEEFWHLQVALAVAAILANYLSLMVLVDMRTLAPVIRLTLINLSFVEIIESAAYMMLRFRYVARNHYGTECVVYFTIVVIMNEVVLNTMVYLSLERLMSITARIYYYRLVGYKFTLCSVVIVWLLAGVVTYFTVFVKLHENIPFCVYHFFVPIRTHFYIGILALARIWLMITINLRVFFRTYFQTRSLSASISDTRARSKLIMARRANMTIMAMVVPYVLFASPLYILEVYFYYWPEFMITCQAFFLLNHLASLLLVSSFFNAVIYTWKLTHVWDRLKRCSHRCHTAFSRTSVSSVHANYPDQRRRHSQLQ